jgi:hypothetical protein
MSRLELELKILKYKTLESNLLFSKDTPLLIARLAK